MRCGFEFRTVYQVLVFSCVILAVCAPSLVLADSNGVGQKTPAEIVSEAVQEHQIVYKLTTLNEFKQIVGQPIKETTSTDGGMEICDLTYPGINARFGRMKGYARQFTILGVAGQGRNFDIGQNRQVVLRDVNDLSLLDTFWGLADVSLVNLDLREYRLFLEDIPFDNLTKWPEPNKLPEGFQPADLLEKGKNPGLGIRKLNEEGIDGSGIGIAVIDQPLLKEHIEYADRLVRYVPIDVEGVPPQMYGSPVCSIAVGKTCGVAPKASLYYYAVSPWKWHDSKPYADTLDKIIELNKKLKKSEKIRVVSISIGDFFRKPNFDLWQKTVAKANKNGILVVTCDPTFLKLGRLRRRENGPPDLPSSYEAVFGQSDAYLFVLAGNRTIASYKGPDVYQYERTGGLSWTVPYLAGLAALAFQVDPALKPDEVVGLWRRTAVNTDAGPVVNPVGFIEAVKKGKLK